MMSSDTSDVRRYQVLSCSACGKDHTSVEFWRYDPPRIDNDGVIWRWAGKCPNTRRILMLRDGSELVQVANPPDLSDTDQMIEEIRQRWRDERDCHDEPICEQAHADVQFLLTQLDAARQALRDEYGA